VNYRVIKEDDLFLLTDENGDISRDDSYGMGLYTKDTRFLSRMELKINGQKPILLSSEADQNFLSHILLTNPHMEEDGDLILWRESIELERKRFINNGGLYEVIKATSYFPKAVSFELSLDFDADFHDMFIVRGFQSGQVGQKTGIDVEQNGMVIKYMGADNIQRETRISWSENTYSLANEGMVTFKLDLKPAESKEILFFIAPFIDGVGPAAAPTDQALCTLRESYDIWNSHSTRIESDNDLFNRLYSRGVQDLRVLITDLGYGPFPVAGLPWFAVPFGRDSLITSLQMLALNPEIAKGTLRTMAVYQGLEINPWKDEQPGKIMHEIRYGELAGTNQIPFTPYYGTIDATPLFLILLIEYYRWTGDRAIVEELMPHVKRALEWIDQYGDRDGDTFVEYFRESSKGIGNQGWKDSGDSIVHRNGDYAISPIALVEVQGYVYQAKSGLADILEEFGSHEWSQQLREQAKLLRQRLDDAFWMEDAQYYAIALDHEKKQVGSVTSNPGHLLMTGILSDSKAKKVSERLVSPDLFSGYGIRTMSNKEIAYNPMSYHDGSVWPHDNSLCILGMSKAGYQTESNKVIEGLLKAANGFEYYRLPELFCGYTDDEHGRPVKYPVACSPQAWAAATPIVFVQSILGFFPNVSKKQIQLNPCLPKSLDRLKVTGIRIGGGHLDIELFRLNGKTSYEILCNTTGCELVNSLKAHSGM
jgi:glycogen debranching enzyme